MAVGYVDRIIGTAAGRGRSQAAAPGARRCEQTPHRARSAASYSEFACVRVSGCTARQTAPVAGGKNGRCPLVGRAHSQGWQLRRARVLAATYAARVAAAPASGRAII